MRSMHLNNSVIQASEALNRVEKLTKTKILPVSQNPEEIKNSKIEFKNVSFSYP
jgi:ATP-binding cassette subfamily B protein